MAEADLDGVIRSMAKKQIKLWQMPPGSGMAG